MEITKTIKLKDGCKLAYCEYGDPKGKPLFYFHGWPGSRLSGYQTDAAAKKLGIRVISPDRPGYGLSDYPKDRTLLDWPDDVCELADQLKINKFSILGSSGGAPYAAACAYKIPKRLVKVGIAVGLAPLDIPGNLDGIKFIYKLGWQNYAKYPFTQTIASSIKYLEINIVLVFVNLLGDQILGGTDSHKKSLYLTVREAFRQGITGPRHDLKLYSNEWGFSLKDIRVPVFLWYGAKDTSASLNMGKYYHSQIPRSKLFIDPNGDHYSRYSHQEEILKALI